MPSSDRVAPDTSLQKVFTFNHEQPVEVVMLNDEPYFVAQDVCKVLDLDNVTKAIASLEKEEYLTLPIVRSGQNRHMLLVGESGLYALIFKSRKPIARTFRRWVTSEVLPAIWKTGRYEAPKQQKLPFFDMEPSPTIMASKPTHCLALSCRRHDGTVKHLFIHYNIKNETAKNAKNETTKNQFKNLFLARFLSL